MRLKFNTDGAEVLGTRHLVLMVLDVEVLNQKLFNSKRFVVTS